MVLFITTAEWLQSFVKLICRASFQLRMNERCMVVHVHHPGWSLAWSSQNQHAHARNSAARATLRVAPMRLCALRRLIAQAQVRQLQPAATPCHEELLDPRSHFLFYQAEMTPPPKHSRPPDYDGVANLDRLAQRPSTTAPEHDAMPVERQVATLGMHAQARA